MDLGCGVSLTPPSSSGTSTPTCIVCIKIMQRIFGSHVVDIVKDKPWKVVIKKL